MKVSLSLHFCRALVADANLVSAWKIAARTKGLRIWMRFSYVGQTASRRLHCMDGHAVARASSLAMPLGQKPWHVGAAGCAVAKLRLLNTTIPRRVMGKDSCKNFEPNPAESSHCLLDADAEIGV